MTFLNVKPASQEAARSPIKSDVISLSLPLSDADCAGLEPGQRVLLSGDCFTLRDASINRLAVGACDEALALRELLKDQLIFFAGPTPPHPATPDLPFGAIGPTTAQRMDGAQISLMDELSGGMRFSLGKGARSKAYREAAAKHGALYFTAIGGAAALLAQHVADCELVAWPELGTEAIQKLRLKDFPAVLETCAQACPEALTQKNSTQYYPGILISFEGGEGAGKSTQIRKLESKLQAAGYEVLTLREPGSSRVSESIREILLNTDNAQLSGNAELLLYLAARAQLVEELVKPALQEGKVVLCDRFFDSTTAYQGYARGIDIDQIDTFNLFATGGIVPRLTFVLDLPPGLGLQRAARTGNPDRLESENLAFHERVRAGFLAIAEAHPDRLCVLDAQQSSDVLADKIGERVQSLLAESRENEKGMSGRDYL